MTERFSPATATKVRAFLKPEQKGPTPTLALSKHAAAIGVGQVYVKDESGRLGTKAFKVSGVAWAMSSWMAKELGCDLGQVHGGMAELRALWEARFPGKPITFCTCTDGNHGAAVALAAKKLGQKAVVYMPKGSADARVENVRRHGGTCTVTELNYDDTVDYAFKVAAENGWQVLQDTTAPNYTEIPSLIMEGYCLMADEALEQIKAMGGGLPTHVILQAGVGSMASAVLAYLVEAYKANPSKRPKAVICEPRDAACIFASAMRADGQAAEVTGDLETMIAGLACGIPSALAWPILSTHVDGGYCWIADGIAGNGMRAAHKAGYEAGECGGAGLGLVDRLMAPNCPKAAATRAAMGLGKDSRVLVINTEGSTDPPNTAKQLKLPDVAYTADDFAFAPPLALGVAPTPTTAEMMSAGPPAPAAKQPSGGVGLATKALLAAAAVAAVLIVVRRAR